MSDPVRRDTLLRYSATVRSNHWLVAIAFVLVVCLLGLLLTGLAMWRAYFTVPVGLVRLASVLHAIFALVLVCAILVHIYAGVWVKGSVHAMLRGTVTPGWAWKHHRAWFRQVTHAANPRARSD